MGETGLIDAARQNDLEQVKSCIESGEDVNQVIKDDICFLIIEFKCQHFFGTLFATIVGSGEENAY